MLVPMVILLYRFRPARGTLALVGIAYAVYGTAAVTSALRHVGNLHDRIGYAFIHAWSLEELPNWVRLEEGRARAREDLGPSMGNLAELMMDFWIEESLELLAAGLLLAALLAVHRWTVPAASPDPVNGTGRGSEATAEGGEIAGQAASRDGPISAWPATLQQAGSGSLFLLTLIAVAALAAHANHDASWTLHAIACLPLLAGLVLVLWHRGGVGACVPGWSGWLLLALAAWTLLGLLWTAVPVATPFEVAVVTAVVVVYGLWCAEAGSGRVGVSAVPMAAMALGGLVAATALVQFALHQQAHLLFEAPAGMAALLNLLWPAAGAAWLGSRFHSRRLALFLAMVLVLTVFVLGINVGLGSLLGAVAALGLLLFVASVLLNDRGGALRLGLMVVGGIGAGALAAALAASPDDGVTVVRGLILAAALEMLGHAPWIGWGPGSFEHAYPGFRDAAEGSLGRHAYNDYLQYWLEHGLPGLLLVGGLVVAALVTLSSLLRRAARGAVGTDHTLAATAAGSAIAATAVTALFAYPLQSLAVLFLLALLLADLDRLQGGKRMPRLGIPDLRRPLVGFTALVVLAVPVSVLYVAHSANQAAQWGPLMVLQGRIAEAESEFASAAARFPWVRGLHKDYAWIELNYIPMTTEEAERRERLDHALALLDEAERMDPFDWEPRSVRGHAYENFPELTAGDPAAAYARALELNPRAVRARIEFAQYLRDEGELEEALALLEAGQELAYGRARPEALADGIEDLRERIEAREEE